MGLRLTACGLLLAGCANAGEKPAGSDAPSTTDGPPGDTLVEGPRMCPTGELATAVDELGRVTCASPQSSIEDAIDASCGVYFGWRDSCGGCTLPPTKWGRAGATCTNVGINTNCTSQTLGSTTVQLLGLNTDGDVNDDDKLYGTLQCTAPPPATSASPCAAGQFVTGRSGASWTCSSVADVAVGYARDNCSLYLGWRDNCGACSLTPSKWGMAGSGRCQNGIGLGNTCAAATLGGEAVTLFGLLLDGDVNGDDKLYIGLHCTPPAPPTGIPTTICPPGQFVVGTALDGSFQCASPADAVHAYLTQRCSIYFGWRDSCDGCTLPPSKWGSVKVGACALGTGIEGTCSEYALGATAVDLFGLGTDGDVDDDDKFYVGLRCE